MTTIAAGTSPTITLIAGQKLLFAAGGAGIATIFRTGAAIRTGMRQLGASPVAIGPFDTDHVISISCDRALSYQTATSPLTSAGFDPAQSQLVDPSTLTPALVSGAGTSILSAASAGQDSGWVTYTPGMRVAYALDSGSTSTTFSVDISADGSTSLGQAFSGTWAATTAEISPPIYLTNTAARYIRFNVLTGGPLSVIRF